jgi:hypothetical protein
VYTCPANLTIIVKYAFLVAGAAAGNAANLGVVTGGLVTIIHRLNTIAGLVAFQAQEMFAVLEPGSTLNVWSDAAGLAIVCRADGARLQGVAP